ncbi:uncharacterized protein At4g06744-like [Euphorbia lathyris]|uniref:uncharacterized protein At4g06744-like n=1 Tax=Euphorbia lathyris TaxID=212925 RepID=UPI003313C99A
MAKIFLLLISILHTFLSKSLAQKCPAPPKCPPISIPTPPRATPRPPRQPLYPPTRHLMPRQPNNNPGPLSNRARILFITQELKRNVTSDPNGITTTWVGNNYCTFRGFFCDTVPDLNITGLAAIDFNGFRLGGNLNFYRFIMNLPDIAFFHANSNNFTGPINQNLNTLRYLYEVDLSNNNFPGGFPQNILRVQKMSFIDIRFNKYLGPVPAESFNIDTEVLFINNNKFNGTIPSNFGNTSALYITVANNKLRGPIPRSIGNARNTLREVLFLGNRMNGCLPYEIGYLRKATVFDVGSNLFTGQIPQSFGCMAKLQLLNMAHNKLYGPIPEVLCRLPNAFNFTLSNNYFTQIGPDCRRLIRLRRLNVNRNCIMGLNNQRSVAECARFFAIPRSCPNEFEYSLVPCTPPSSMKITAPPTVEEAPAPRSYKALERPRH